MNKIILATYNFHEHFRSMFETKIEIASTKESIRNADVVIFTGGEDISPAIYGEENKSSYTNEERDARELEILVYALKLNKKIVGVCRGHQLINAALGGKLLQDISPSHPGRHPLMEKSGIIGELFKDEVNSMHHQGVIIPGEGLVPTSFYQNMIESTEGINIFTVQFHPEFMNKNENMRFANFILNW